MYSDNIVFLDTEFTDLNARTGELLSIGMVAMDGSELYLEFEYHGPVHPWVEKNILPTLTRSKVTKIAAEKIIRKWVGESKPYAMAYVNQFDAIFWYDLMGSPKDTNPVFWIPIDFASILFANGDDPNSFAKDSFFTDLGIDVSVYTKHNALDDAQMLKEVYHKYISRL
jgi:DNA polymerase III epsilon subunit-like protein